jgi:Sigma-54 interaction domain
MENQSNAVPGGWSRPDSLDDASRLLEAWDLARSAQVNVLLMGLPQFDLRLSDGSNVLHNVIERILPDVAEPISSWHPGQRLVLPPRGHVNTMILHDVGAMVYEDQLRLLDWLDTMQGRTQVVSTTSEPLLTRVRAGLFLATLYYRLNTVSVNVTL